MIRAPGVAKQGPQKLPVVRKDVEFGLKKHAEALLEGSAQLEPFARYNGVHALHALVIGHDESLFAWEVVISQAQGDASFACDFAHGCFVESSLAKHPDSRIKNAVPRRASARCGRRSLCAQIARILGVPASSPTLEHVQYNDTPRRSDQRKSEHVQSLTDIAPAGLQALLARRSNHCNWTFPALSIYPRHHQTEVPCRQA